MKDSIITKIMPKWEDDFASMTIKQAKWVKKLRNPNANFSEEGYTWRAIASTCNDKWKGNWNSNQIAGMEICRQAAKLLKEDWT